MATPSCRTALRNPSCMRSSATSTGIGPPPTIEHGSPSWAWPRRSARRSTTTTTSARVRVARPAAGGHADQRIGGIGIPLLQLGARKRGRLASDPVGLGVEPVHERDPLLGWELEGAGDVAELVLPVAHVPGGPCRRRCSSATSMASWRMRRARSRSRLRSTGAGQRQQLGLPIRGLCRFGAGDLAGLRRGTAARRVPISIVAGTRSSPAAVSNAERAARRSWCRSLRPATRRHRRTQRPGAPRRMPPATPQVSWRRRRPSPARPAVHHRLRSPHRSAQRGRRRRGRRAAHGLARPARATDTRTSLHDHWSPMTIREEVVRRPDLEAWANSSSSNTRVSSNVARRGCSRTAGSRRRTLRDPRRCRHDRDSGARRGPTMEWRRGAPRLQQVVIA